MKDFFSKFSLDSVQKYVGMLTILSITITGLVYLLEKLTNNNENVFGIYDSLQVQEFKAFELIPNKRVFVIKDSIKLKNAFDICTRIQINNQSDGFISNVKIPLNTFTVYCGESEFKIGGFYNFVNSDSLFSFNKNDCIKIHELKPYDYQVIYVYSECVEGPYPINFEYSNRKAKVYPVMHIIPQGRVDYILTYLVLENRWIQIILFFTFTFSIGYLIRKIFFLEISIRIKKEKETESTQVTSKTRFRRKDSSTKISK